MSDYNFGPAFKILGGLCVAGGLAIGGVIWGATALFNHATAETPLVSLSEGRQQLLEEGYAGPRVELQGFLSQQVNEYFKGKGFPCDPVKASRHVLDTSDRGRCQQPGAAKP